MERFQGAMLGIFRKQNFVTEYEGGEGVKVNLQVTNSHNWRKSGVPFTEPGNPGEVPTSRYLGGIQTRMSSRQEVLRPGIDEVLLGKRARPQAWRKSSS